MGEGRSPAFSVGLLRIVAKRMSKMVRRQTESRHSVCRQGQPEGLN